MQYLMDIALLVGYYCDSQHATKWAKQNEKPYYFLVFNEITKNISVQRWGQSKRPPNTDKRLWYRVKVTIPQSYEPKIYAVLKDLSSLWDNIAFDPENSEKVPKIYSNTKFDNKVFFMKSLFDEQSNFRNVGRM